MKIVYRVIGQVGFDVITSFSAGYQVRVGRVRTGTAQALDAGCPVLYDVAAAERGVTSLFGAAGRGYNVAPAKRGVTSLFG